MGKKQNKDLWPEAIRQCQLNTDDVEKAKKLGFQPHKLISSIPKRRQPWKLPVNEWVRELYCERFGLGPNDKDLQARAHVEVGIDEEAQRLFGEHPYWEDCPIAPDGAAPPSEHHWYEDDDSPF